MHVLSQQMQITADGHLDAEGFSVSAYSRKSKTEFMCDSLRTKFSHIIPHSQLLCCILRHAVRTFKGTF